MNERAEVKDLEMVDDTHAVAIEIKYTRILGENTYVIFNVRDNTICNTFGCGDKDVMIKAWNDWKKRFSK